MHLKPLRHFPLLLTALLLGACAPEAGPAARTVTDDLDRVVALPGTPARVVTLAPNLTEIVFAAGAGRLLAGVTTADDFPPAVDTLPHVSALPLDFEAVVALEPDLILATDHVNSVADAQTFEAVGIPVFFFSYDDLEGMLRSLRTAGGLLGTPAAADRAADSLEAALAALHRATDTLAVRPLTLFLIGDETLFSFGDESYVHDLIALAGGRSATEDIGANAPVLSDEFVLANKPEVIIGAFGEDYDPARLLALHPTWDIVPALRDGRVYGIDPSLILRPGPRLVEGVRRMAAMLHPALFEAPAEPAARAALP